ncbi:MAG: hypothetical protein IT558_05950 [Alphaproteobacteria bacterium]|nr:hypothetical protein [Alphaproteobacteria bacterium]
MTMASSPAINAHFDTAGAATSLLVLATDRDGTLVRNNSLDSQFLKALIAARLAGHDVHLCSKGEITKAAMLPLQRKSIPLALGQLGAADQATQIVADLTPHLKHQYLRDHPCGAHVVFDDEPLGGQTTDYPWAGNALHIVPGTPAFSHFVESVLAAHTENRRLDLRKILDEVLQLEGAYTPERPYAGTAQTIELTPVAVPAVAA